MTRERSPNGRDVTSPIPTVAAGTPCCGYYYYPDNLGGLGADGTQGVWTYSAFGHELARNTSPVSNTLAITHDTVAPTTPVLDLPAAEDSYPVANTDASLIDAIHSDNVTNTGVWHFWASSLGEQGYFMTRELSPNGRDVTSPIPTVAAGTPCCGYYYYPDNQGGSGADGTQGVWTYSAFGVDLAGNTTPVSNTLAITHDSVAPATPVLDLPAAEDSYPALITDPATVAALRSDNITSTGVWHFWASSLGEQGYFMTRELSPNGRDVTSPIPTVAAGTPCCGYYYYPDNQGGSGADGTQGVWTYSAFGVDLAGNATPVSNTLAITHDTVAPTTPVLDLPASEDSYPVAITDAGLVAALRAVYNTYMVDWQFCAISLGER